MQIQQNLSPEIKYMADGTAAAIAWSHFLGFWKDNVGMIAATVSLVWLGIQIGEYIYKKFKK